VNRSNLRLLVSFAALLLLGMGLMQWWQQREIRHFLTGDMSAFVASFAEPPARNSAVTRVELEELLGLQASRTPEQVEAARADRRTDIGQFYAALGLDPKSAPKLPALERLAEHVEDDVRIHVRAVKEKFRRLRPYEIEPRLEPCIDDVRGDLSYPSGHSAFGWSMFHLLAGMVPERQAALEARAREFARQRMICGVHFTSDLEAGRLAAARLYEAMNQVHGFRQDFRAASAELRAALQLPALTAQNVTALLEEDQEPFPRNDVSWACELRSSRFKLLSQQRSVEIGKPMTLDEFHERAQMHAAYVEAHQAGHDYREQDRESFCRSNPPDRVPREFRSRHMLLSLRIEGDAARYQSRQLLLRPVPLDWGWGLRERDSKIFSVIDETGTVVIEDQRPVIAESRQITSVYWVASDAVPEGPLPDP
jgi:acid phosphatase (class A)